MYILIIIFLVLLLVLLNNNIIYNLNFKFKVIVKVTMYNYSALPENKLHLLLYYCKY